MHDKFDTIDFCEGHGEAAMVVRAHLSQPHLPSHEFVKFRRVVHIRECGKAYKDAKDAVDRARRMLDAEMLAAANGTRKPNVDEDNESPGCQTPGYLTCGGCRQVVSQPCWFCVQCTGMFLLLAMTL
jgi:hypothetical protein